MQTDTTRENPQAKAPQANDSNLDLAATAPDGSVLDVCEDAVIERGREHQRRLLQRAVQARLDAAEKKGRR